MVLGVVGFFYSAAFGKPGDVGDVFGVFAVNGWHNLVHLLPGLLGLAVWRSYAPARKYAVGVSALYGALAIWGFVIGDGKSILGIVPVSSADNVLHLLLALAGIFAGIGTAETPRPSGAGAEPDRSFRELRI